jgi:hypothetical protein
MAINKHFYVEVEKGLNWEDGFLNSNSEVVPDITKAALFDSKEDAEEAASLFNIEHGKGGRIYARVR